MIWKYRQPKIFRVYNVNITAKEEHDMADKRNSSLSIPPQGFLRGLLTRAKLILSLMGDKRISPWVKLIPIGTFIYWISPIDLIMGIPGVDALDDAAVSALGSYRFIELCPPGIVQEHMKKLTSNRDIVDGQDEVIDADSVDIKDK